MNTLTKKICAIAVAGAFSATAQANGLQNSGDLPNIPLVPIETMSNLPKLPAPTSAAAAPIRSEMRPVVSGSAGAVPAQSGPISIMATPGVNQLTTVAVSHLNRIVTPFDQPEVITSGGATVEVRDNVVYIGTNSEVPLSMYVTEKGEESEAISLTLVPRRVPPREITVYLGAPMQPGADGFVPTSANGKPLPMRSNSRIRKADAWEKSDDYVSTLTSLLNQLALGQMPVGYDLMDWDGTSPPCQQTGVIYSFANGQTIKGSELHVQVGVAYNDSDQPIEIDEQACGDWRVAAVAAFPSLALQPGERTEMFVVMKANPVAVERVKRPSLVQSGNVELF